MATPPTESGEIIGVGPLGATLDGSKIAATVLVKAPTLEVIRLVVPAGKDIANHTAPGDITVQKGAVDFTAGGRTQRLSAGRLAYLAAGTRHALGVEDASVLVTIVRADRGGRDAG